MIWSSDAQTLQAQLDDISRAGRGHLHIPAGRYELTAPLCVKDSHVSITGAGRGVTELVWTKPGGGLQFEASKYNQRLTVRDLSLLAACPDAGVALRATWPTPPPYHDAMQEPHVSDVHIGPVDQHVDFWTKGLEATNARGLKLARFYINGRSDTFSMTHGVHLLGSSVIVSITNGAIYSAQEGIVAEEQAEGLYLSHVEVVMASVGYRFQAVAGSSITGCHANTTSCGIRIVGHNDMAVIGNLLYRLGSGGYTGIHLESSPFCVVQGNNVAITARGGYRNGIVLVGNSHGCVVTGNILREMDSGVWLAGGGSDRNAVSGNRGVDCWRTVTDHGVGNLVKENL